jgi:transcription antitermination factor NusG
MDGGWIMPDRNRDYSLDGSGAGQAMTDAAVHGANRTDCGSMRGPRWYAVAAKYRQAEAAATAILALGFETFLPLVSVPLPNGARETRPMFGKYLFARFDVACDPWGQIKRLSCLPDRPILYLSDPCRPTPVPTRMIDQMRRRMIDSLVVPDPVATLVAIGAEVRLVDGPMDGRAGTVDAVKRGGREARVAVDGFSLPVWVPADRLTLLA